MNESEQFYLAKFRELTAKKKAVMSKIADLQRICASLSDWQKTAGELSNPGFGPLHEEWSDESLAGLADLRLHLTAYHRQMEDIERAWSKLPDNEKVGLAEPRTLRPPSS
jgi:hypothetical protein